MKLLNIYKSRGQNGDVYSTDGVCPTLRSGQGVVGHGIGSNNAPKILIVYETLEKTRQPRLEGRAQQSVEHHRPSAVGEPVLRLTALEHMEDLRDCTHDNNED